jgi:hypothetical protein
LTALLRRCKDTRRAGAVEKSLGAARSMGGLAGCRRVLKGRVCVDVSRLRPKARNLQLFAFTCLCIHVF